MKNKSQGKKKAASRGGVQGLVKAVASNLSVKQQKRDLRRAEKAAAAADGSDTHIHRQPEVARLESAPRISAYKRPNIYPTPLLPVRSVALVSCLLVALCMKM